MKNPRYIKIAALLLALSFIEPRVAYADAKEDAAQAAKDIDKAYDKAQENIPDKDIKDKEDELDKAARKNDETQGDPAKDPTGGKDPAKDPAKEKAQKNEDDARDKADKADPDKTGAPYREALKKRREACKRLKKALDDLRQQLQKRRKLTSDNSDIEQAIRDAEAARKRQEKVPAPPTLSMVAPQGAPTLATFVASGKVKIDSVGTGETIGHVADLKIQNLTDQPLRCAVPPMILESGSGNNQHYACPKGQTVALNSHQTKTVPMNGVCLNRNKPPVGKGVSGDLVINEANTSGPQNPNSHIAANQAGDLLRICTAKYTVADQLQKSGALKNLPYHDPQKQKDIVVQWSTWCDPRISQITGAPPATKDDLRKVVYKQLESKKPMSPETKKKVDQGIDTIFEKVELTTAKAKDLENTNLPAPGASSGSEVTPPPSGTNGPGQPNASDFQDPNAHFEGDEISDVAQMKGSSFFFRLGQNESVLIKISEIELVKNADGFAVLGRLIGERVWGSNRFEKFNIDNSPEYQKRGLTKVTTLDDVNCGAPGSNNQVHFDKIRFRRLVTHGYPMLAITEMHGRNLLTNEALSGRLNIPDIVGRFVCPAVFDWDCWNTACSGYGCNLPACSCNGTGFCNWVIVGTKCVPTSCSGTCRNPIGWSSFCPCL